MKRPLAAAPLLPPSLAFATGAALAGPRPGLSAPLLALLAALGLALAGIRAVRRKRDGGGTAAPGSRTRRLGGTSGLLVAALALGALEATAAARESERGERGFDPERPVVARGRIEGHFEADEEDWIAPFAVERWSQGARSTPARSTVLLRLPGAEEPPPFGARLEVTGYLRRSVGFANAGGVEPGPFRLAVKSRVFVEIVAPPGPIAGFANRLRRTVERSIAEAEFLAERPPGAGAALARAFVLGDASRIAPATKRGLRWTGLYHLLSVSGVHVALAAALAFALGAWLPRLPRLALAAAVVALYLLLAGPLPALVRAAAMGLLAIAALALGRPPAALNGLGFALLVAVASRPEIATDLSFQLSISATAGLLVLGPRFAEQLRSRPAPVGAAGHGDDVRTGLRSGLATSLGASLGAELASLPFSLPRFHLLTVAAPLFNLAAIPWAGIALTASFAWTALALAWPEGAAAVSPLLDAIAAPLAWPARVPGALRPALPTAIGVLGAAVLAGGSITALALCRRRRRTRLVAALALSAAVAVVAVDVRARRVAAGSDPTFAMLDVGQGDAILLRDRRRAILIDGGGWRRGDLGGRVLLPALLAEGIASLDALVMTHPDLDHCQGLVDIAGYLRVREVWLPTARGVPGEGRADDEAGCARALASIPGATVRELSAGMRGRVGRIRLDVLAPNGSEGLSENDRSLVLRASVLGRSALLVGDVEKAGELRLLDLPRESLRADLLKVAHHGSRTSSIGPFLDAVAPRLALISAGVRNPYGHPSPEVVDRLSRKGARILRTDRDGEIRIAVRPDGRLRVELPGSPKNVR